MTYIEQHKDESIMPLVNALKRLNFIVHGACSGHIDQLASGPVIEIEASTTRNYLGRLQELRGAGQDMKDENYRNLFIEMQRDIRIEKSRLITYLGEFYTNRSTDIYSRLIVGAFWCKLQCQGAAVMELLERKAVYPKWRHDAQAEMTSFAEFLHSKVQ